MCSSPPLISASKNESVKELIHKFDGVINDRVVPIYEKYNKSIIIGLSYPSNEFSTWWSSAIQSIPCLYPIGGEGCDSRIGNSGEAIQRRFHQLYIKRMD